MRPTEVSAIYHIGLRYRLGTSPEVRVLAPSLTTRDGNPNIPHMYGQERLCLYLPGNGEWSASMPLGRTVIPWTAEWLFYYELWHATGEWLGGGHETMPSGPYPEESEVIIDGSTRSRR